MKKAIRILLHAALFLAAVPLHAEPAMPEGFVARWTDSSGLTWRETGSMPLSFDKAAEALKASMKEQSYFLRHDIFDKSLPDHRLFLFVKDGEEVTVMLWRIDGENTGLGWGVTKKKEANQ